jgi:hypothetical protein
LLDQSELAHCANRQGESNTQVLAYRILRFCIITGLAYGFAWSAILNFFVTWSLQKIFIVQVISLLPTSFALFQVRGSAFSSKPGTKAPLGGGIEIGPKSKMAALFSWRLRQMIFRNRAAYLSLLIALITACLQYLAQDIKLPIFITVMIAACAGLFIAGAMAFQLQSDMENAWLDHSLGVSHRDIVQTYLLLGLVLGIFFGALHGLVVLLGTPLTTMIDLIKVVGVTALAPVLFPSIMFQLDARRPSLQIMTIFFIALFIATAILVHWLSFLIVPLVYYYANNYQIDNYYRS